MQVSVIDPEDEYLRLADAVGGTVVRLGAPGVRVNPLDLPAGDTRPDVLTRRGLFLHTLIACCSGSSRRRRERAALDRAILAAYRHGRDHRRPGHLPPAGAAAARPRRRTAPPTATRPPAATLAARLAPWVAGSFKDLFDGPTTHRPDGHLVVWSLRHLPDELRTVGTLLALDAIWRHVDTARPRPQPGRAPAPGGGRRGVDADARRRRRPVPVPDGKAARKRNAGLTVITQDAADVLGTDLGQAVVANAATQILLRQAPQAIDAVADAFGLTAGERRLLLAARRGHGLLISGAHRAAFESIASTAEHRLCTTTPADLVDLDAEEDAL